jgi:hypothetical protein
MRLPPVVTAVLVAGAAGAAVTGVAGAAGTPVLQVTPARGTPRTAFSVHFVAPVATGAYGGSDRSYALSAAPVTRSRGCITSVSLSPDVTTAGEAVSVKLDPARLGGRWCLARYSGTVDEIGRASCGPIVARGPADAMVCPQYEVVLARLGTFSFRVARTHRR